MLQLVVLPGVGFFDFLDEFHLDVNLNAQTTLRQGVHV